LSVMVMYSVFMFYISIALYDNSELQKEFFCVFDFVKDMKYCDK